MASITKIQKSFSVQFLSVLVSFADRILIVGLLIRAFGTDVYADWMLLLASTGIIGLLELGLNLYFGNVLQKQTALGEGARFQRFLNIGLTCSICAFGSIAAVTLLVAFCLDVSKLLSLSTMRPAAAAEIFTLLGFVVASRVGRGIMASVYRGRGAYAGGLLIDLCSQIAILAVSSVVALTGGGPRALAYFYLVSDLIAGWGLMLFDMRRRFPDLLFQPALPTPEEVCDIGRHLPWFAILQGTPTALLQSPVLILGWYAVTGPALISFLLLRTLVNFGRQIGSMMSNSIGVELVSDYHSGNSSRLARHLRTFGSGLSAMASASGIAILAFGEPVIHFWTGLPVLYDSGILGWLLIGALIAAPITPVAYLLSFANLPRPGAIANLLQLGVGFVGALALTPAYGALGASAAMAAGELAAAAIVLPAAVKPFNINLAGYLGGCFLTMCLCAAWCGVVALAARKIIEPTTIGALVIDLTLWGLLGFAPALLATLPAARARLANFVRASAPKGIPPALR